MTRTYSHGSIGVRAIEVLLYIYLNMLQQRVGGFAKNVCTLGYQAKDDVTAINCLQNLYDVGWFGKDETVVVEYIACIGGICMRIQLLCLPPKMRGWLIIFSADTFGVGVGVTLFINSISLISQWNFIIFAWIHHWDKPKLWLDFGDFDVIFNVIWSLRQLDFMRRLHIPKISHYPIGGFLPNLHTFIISTNLSAD